MIILCFGSCRPPRISVSPSPAKTDRTVFAAGEAFTFIFVKNSRQLIR